jgi:hypothetical protein
MIGGVIDASLKNTTAVAVSSDLNTVRGDCVVNELESDFSVRLNFITSN